MLKVLCTHLPPIRTWPVVGFKNKKGLGQLSFARFQLQRCKYFDQSTQGKLLIRFFDVLLTYESSFGIELEPRGIHVIDEQIS